MGTIKRNFSNNITPTGKFDSADLTGTIPATNVADASLTNVTSVPASVGDLVQKVASDPTPVGAGDVWYNTTSNALKSVIQSSAWSSGANLITTRYGSGGAGTQTEALAIGGAIAPAGPFTQTATEEYNGSGWSNGGALGTGRYLMGGAGTQTAGLAFGGRLPPGTNVTEEYDGSSWTAGGNMGTARFDLGDAGIQTSALAFGGRNPPSGPYALNEEYNGTTWSEQNDLNTARPGLAGCGIETAALAFSGAPNRTDTEEYNGTSWTSVNGMNTGRVDPSGTGTQNAALAFGGGNPGPTSATEEYDGTSWTTSSGSLAVARRIFGGAGTQTAGLGFGGYTDPGMTGVTEEYNVSTNVITGAAWASGGNLNTGKRRGTGGGTQTAGIYMNGGDSNTVEEYNGTSWSEQNDMPVDLRDPCGFGTQTAFVGCAGYQPGPNSSQNATNEYDGTNWTAGGNVNTARDGASVHSGGTLTAGLINGGGLSPHKQTEEYDGTSWANANASSNGHYRTTITGTQTAAYMFGGYGIDPASSQPGESVTFTELYDGTSWTAGTTLLVGSNASLGMASSNRDDSTCAGGFDQIADSRNSLTQNYNGTAWRTGASLGTARYAGTGGGTSSGGFVAGGNSTPGPGGISSSTEELTPETSATNVVTISSS